MFFASKLLFTGLCVLTIVVPSVMDLNATHLTNPLWPPHARFHWALNFLSTTVLNGLALFLLWGSYPDRDSVLVTWVVGLAPVLFWGLFFPALLLPGTGTWPDGVVPPPTFPALLKRLHPNVLIAGTITVLAGLGIWLDLARR